MIDPIVRAATAADRLQLPAIAAEARAALRDVRGGERWLDTHPAPDWADATVFVGLIDDVVIGYIVLDVDVDIARIDEVYVLSDARELGFGDELLGAAASAASAAGARLLEGEALPGDRDTKNLYERAGIKARLITVSAPLVADADGSAS